MGHSYGDWDIHAEIGCREAQLLLFQARGIQLNQTETIIVKNDSQDLEIFVVSLERSVALAALQNLRSGLHFQFIGDSRVLVDCLMGRAGTTNPCMERSIQLGHVALKTLCDCFCILPPDEEDFAKNVPRADNSAADAAANLALDSGNFYHVLPDGIQSFLQQLATGEYRLGLAFSFDGAARGNPGPSSAGVCAWWGRFVDGGFLESGLVLQRGIQLGIGTNNSAEALALTTAVKTALRFNF